MQKFSQLNDYRRKSQEEYRIREVSTPNRFLNDYTRIIESKSFRRLQDKAQVYCRDPKFMNMNIRNRATHTNEVISLSMKVSDILGLNSTLTQAQAAGHDIGHVPFGHLGEEVFCEYGKKFKHNIFSVIVSQEIERKGKGLNLTYSVLEGILNHSRGKGKMSIGKRFSEEANIVMYADKIAYTFSDINDAVRVGDLKKLPFEVMYFGRDQREREYFVIDSLIRESREKGRVSFEDSEAAKKFEKLKNFMYENVYFKQNREREKNILRGVIDFMPSILPNINPLLPVALMTDGEVHLIYGDLMNGKRENIKDSLLRQLDKERAKKEGEKSLEGPTGVETQFGFYEIIPYVEEKDIDMYNSDLNVADFKS